MKHIFIINPASGKENLTEKLTQQIQSTERASECEIYITKGPGDATDYIKAYCSEHQEPVRFYACGGDGTLHEAVNGVAPFPFAAVGCIPCGSGNDFVKYYDHKDAFLDVQSQINGQEHSIDLIRVGDRYAINAVHFGLDSCVANLIIQNRRKKIIGGKHVYLSSVIISMFVGLKHKCRIEADGEPMTTKEFITLCTIANGQYVGGSYHCAPRSINDDGLLEVCSIDQVSLFTFLRICFAYRAGKHFEDPRFKSILNYKRAKKVHVTAPEGFVYSMDGEVIQANDFTVEVVPQAIKFIVPQGCEATANS